MNGAYTTDLQRRIQTLEDRLNHGYEVIDRRREAGLDVSKLEDFWVALLHELELACDELAAEAGRNAA